MISRELKVYYNSICLFIYDNVIMHFCFVFAFQCMKECGVWKFVFSSSATVYGTPQNLPISEDHPVGIGITNPYGRSKFFIEEIIKDLCKAEKVLKIAYL